MNRRPRLRARDKRALVLGLVVITPFAAYRVAIEPWLTYRNGLSETLVAERDLLARERTLIRGAAAMPARVGEMETALTEVQPWLLGGATSMAATGQLTRIATDAAQSTGILLQEVQGREPNSTATLREISIAVRALGDLEGLARFLYSVENGEELLQVRELALRVAGMNDGDLERGQLMSAGLIIAGYWQTPPGADSIEVAEGQQ